MDPTASRAELDRVTVRFAGDSGDGLQVVGSQLTNTSAVFGNDLSTLPDYPAEIRAPAGTLPGVSAFQISFASEDIHTPGDAPDVLVALNPAALKVNLEEIPEGGTLIVNEDSFTTQGLNKAGYDSNPLDDDSLSSYRVIGLPITSQNEKALAHLGLSPRQAGRSKNFYALGIIYWLYDRPLEPTLRWFQEKWGARPQVVAANTAALKAGYAFADTTELFTSAYRVPPAALPAGTYRNITGNQATALGFITASHLADRTLFYASYPITPASTVLHELARHRNLGIVTFQAEDEMAAIGAAIGAAFGGSLALTGTSGPGLALKSEGAGAGGGGGAAAGGDRRAACRSLDRNAHQDRAGGPAAGDVRPQRRSPGSHRRPGHPRRLLRHGAGGVPHRGHLHDPRAVSLRRLPGQRLRTVADPGDGRPAVSAGAVPHRSGGLPALHPRSPYPGAAVGDTRHPGAGASCRRPGQGRRDRQRELRPAEQRAHDTAARTKDRRGSRPASHRWRYRDPTAADCWCSAGAAPTAPSPPPARSCAPRAWPCPTPTCDT